MPGLQERMDMLLFSGNEEVTKENANKNPDLASTFRDLEAGEVSRHYALTRVLPRRVADAHRKGWIHFHDLDYTVPGGMFNCMLVDLEGILARRDFKIGNTWVEDVKSIETATDLIPQIAAQVSVSQYGGQTYQELDSVLEPYAEYTYRRELKHSIMDAADFHDAHEPDPGKRIGLDAETARKIVDGERDPIAVGLSHEDVYTARRIAAKRLRSIVFDSMQGLEYAINTVQGNGQTPFVTVSFGRSTSWIGRLIQQAILETRINGYGPRHDTPVFPKLIFLLEEGVNLREGDPNHDIKRLALHCASKRIYPDFISVDNLKDLLGFVPTSMGCFAGDHVVAVRSGSEGDFELVTGEELWDRASRVYGARIQPNGVDEYINIPSGAMEAKDSHTGVAVGTSVLRLVRNRSSKWVDVKLRDASGKHGGLRFLRVTEDHPLPVEGRGRVMAGDLEVGDLLQRSMSPVTDENGDEPLSFFTSLDEACERTRLAVASIKRTDSGDAFSYDLTTASDYFDLNGVVSHNCRSFLSYYEDPETGEPMTNGRFNVGVVTLNLPNIALSASSREEFMCLLDERATVVREALDFRFDQVKAARASQSPIHYITGAAHVSMGPEEAVGDLVEGGRATASFGYIGLYETVARFYGGDWYDDPEAVEFSLDVMRRINHHVDTWKAENGRGYGVYGTPSESLCDRFARMDRETFGDVPDITDKGYYQNSFHVDVRREMTPFEKYDFEQQYIEYSQGGHILYVETDSLLKNQVALESIVDYAVDHGVTYFGVNQPVSKCYSCEYEGEFDADVRGFFCPSCGERDPERMSAVRRVCGYLSLLSERPVCDGKRLEIVNRVKHARVSD